MFDVIEYKNEMYVAEGWNGEYYSECYKLASWCKPYRDTFPAPGWENRTIALKPIIKECECVGYVEL